MNDSGETSSGLRHRHQGSASDIRQSQDAGDVDRRWWETEESSKPPVRPSISQSLAASQPVGSSQRAESGPSRPPLPPPLNPDWFRAAAPGSYNGSSPSTLSAGFSPIATGLPQERPDPGDAHDSSGPAVATWASPTGGAPVAGTPKLGNHLTADHGATPYGSATAPANTSAQLQAAQADLEALTVQRLELELAAARDEAAALHEMLEDLPEIFERKFHQRLQSILEQQQRLLADNQTLREQLYTLAPGVPGVETRPNRLLLPATQPSMPPLQRRSPLGETLRKVLRLGRSDITSEPPDSNRFR